MTTQETIKKAVDYAKENNIKNIVVATTTGGNLTYLEDEKDLHIVGVTNAYDQGQNQMREEVRKHFEEAGMDIVTAGHALSGAERCFSTYFGGYGPTEIVANTLRMFSQGVKVCVEVSTMALDAGKIPYQEKIVAIAGSGRGADTVVLLTPSYTKSILDTKVHKIIEMPGIEKIGEGCRFMNRKKISIILFIVMILSELFAGIVFLLPISGFFMYPFVSGFAVIMGIFSAVLAKDLIVLRVIAIVAVVFCVFTIGADLMMVLEFMGVIG